LPSFTRFDLDLAKQSKATMMTPSSNRLNLEVIFNP
jgi:hypothetical protein